MSDLFNQQKISVYRNEVQTINRKISSGYMLVAEHIPCRLTGTHDGGVRLFIHQKNLKKFLPLGLHKNYKIVLEDGTKTYLSEYVVGEEPIWAGGVKHHQEVKLSEV